MYLCEQGLTATTNTKYTAGNHLDLSHGIRPMLSKIPCKKHHTGEAEITATTDDYNLITHYQVHQQSTLSTFKSLDFLVLAEITVYRHA